jgi:DNA-binding winged helix-turn-helix (wHTH) protein
VDAAFGDFRLDSGGRRLLRRGGYVHLSRKAYELLAFLIDSRPRALSKAELQERLWPKSFVVEANLSNLVAELRAALGDDPRHPRFIRTLHGFGYAFSDAAVPLESAETPPRSAGRLLCWLDWGERRVQVDDGEHLIGRDRTSILTIDSHTVSRRHALIRVGGEQAVLTDLGSRNGTYVRGTRIECPTALADGDEIRMGAVILAFRVALAPPSTVDFPAPDGH